MGATTEVAAVDAAAEAAVDVVDAAAGDADQAMAAGTVTDAARRATTRLSARMSSPPNERTRQRNSY
jgi:hypothetical protein